VDVLDDEADGEEPEELDELDLSDVPDSLEDFDAFFSLLPESLDDPEVRESVR